MSKIKTDKQIKLLKEAGKKLGSVLREVKSFIKPGITTLEIDKFVHDQITQKGCKPSFLHYEGYPNSSCISINEEVIHTIPSGKKITSGDIITVDVGLWYKGVCVDAARTFAVEKSKSTKVDKLLDLTNKALRKGIAEAREGNRIGQISHAIEKIAKKGNLGIVRSFTGHGVGLAVHEDPSVPNVGKPGDGEILKSGMVLAIEPMFTLGNGEVVTLADGWTVQTADGSLSAQFEDTVVVTKNDPVIVTK